MIELRDEDYCSECSSVLRSDEVDRGLCEVCYYYPELKKEMSEYHFECLECGLKNDHKMSCSHRPGTRQWAVEQGLTLDVEFPEDDDFLAGITCNPNDPEECESCQ